MKKLLWIPTVMVACLASRANAIDPSNGLISALPVQDGRTPVIDGDIKEWDWSAAVPSYISEQTARSKHAEWSLMYDDNALYVAVRASLPNRALSNPNSPQDAFWNSDILQLRVAADPALQYPIDPNRDQNSDRIAHISMWKNTETGTDYLNINRGTKFDKGQDSNPPGSAVAIKTQGTTGYVAEARIPWSALRVPGGTNPFKAGQRMAGVLETLWIGGDSSRVASVYRSNPGVFAFQNSGTWGQIEFAKPGQSIVKYPTMQAILAQMGGSDTPTAPQVGVPISINMPYEGKISVNIFGKHGEVLRELVGGLPRPKGPFEVRFDGRDQWGQPLAAGTYRWGAYISRGLKAQFVGGVGKSGTPYYETPDGKGGWGADHTNPIDTAADASGLYFLWPVGEGSRPVVKTGYDGKVIWRKSPYVGGGFGPFYAIASDSKFVYLTLGDTNPRLVKLDAASGQLLTWDEKGLSELPLGEGKVIKVPEDSSPLTFDHYGAAHISQPESVGLAAREGTVFVSLYSQNKIAVINAATGKREREIECPSPRGVCLDARGNLYAVSYTVGQTPRVLRFEGAAGIGKAVVASNLEAPWDVAVGADSRLFVSDLGKVQQIKTFAANGNLLKPYGKLGGRPWQGRFDSQGFLNPAGLAIDSQNSLLVAEAAIPKVFDRINTRTGAVQKRWFGSPIYWSTTWPSLDDPREVYTTLTAGIARYKLPTIGGDKDQTEAYWSLTHAGYPHSANFENNMPHPEWVRAGNGRDYLVCDANPHTVALKIGDLLRPVANFNVINNWHPNNKSKSNYMEVWIDANGDGQMQPSESSKLETVDGKPMVPVADMTDSMHMEPNGDLYFMTQANSILKIPAAGTSANGLMKWNLAAATYIVRSVLPSKKNDLSTTVRHGLHGARLDKAGDIYTVFNTTIEGKGEPFEYATPELAAQMKEGLGHTATFNVVKVAKFNPQGKLLWMAGRKATAAASPGEMYHFWNMAGLVNDRYIAGGSEWGPVYFYTHDGFFVDALMENPGLNPPPGPYTFGGETSGARVQYFPRRDELWAYSSGMAYQVVGFKGGQVEGETRLSGTVALDKIYDAQTTSQEVVGPLQIVPLTGTPLTSAEAWNSAPIAKMAKAKELLATAQLGYDTDFLYARIHVKDSSPLQNGADTLSSAFKGGDTAGIVLGPRGAREQAGTGDIRLMAVQLDGKARLIAMKSVTTGEKRSERYFTPAGGEAKFEFVGEVPGGQVVLVTEGDGYTATFAVPRAFFELNIAPTEQLSGDVEVRLSGNGQRGLQTTSRNYLFTPPSPLTTMTDDVPTEARLYPKGWGNVEVK